MQLLQSSTYRTPLGSSGFSAEQVLSTVVTAQPDDTRSAAPFVNRGKMRLASSLCSIQVKVSFTDMHNLEFYVAVGLPNPCAHVQSVPHDAKDCTG